MRPGDPLGGICMWDPLHPAAIRRCKSSSFRHERRGARRNPPCERAERASRRTRRSTSSAGQAWPRAWRRKGLNEKSESASTKVADYRPRRRDETSAIFAPAQVHAVHESLTLEALLDRVHAAEGAAVRDTLKPRRAQRVICDGFRGDGLDLRSVACTKRSVSCQAAVSSSEGQPHRAQNAGFVRFVESPPASSAQSHGLLGRDLVTPVDRAHGRSLACRAAVASSEGEPRTARGGATV